MQFPNTFQPTQQFAYQTQGILDRPMTPEAPGRVYFEATYWRARLFQPTATNPINKPANEVIDLLASPPVSTHCHPLATR